MLSQDEVLLDICFLSTQKNDVSVNTLSVYRISRGIDFKI